MLRCVFPTTTTRVGENARQGSSTTPTRVVVVGKTNRNIDVAENCVELTNQTSLLQLVRLIRVARFVISVDSGPMHIAAAVNGRLLSIHTRTNPRRAGPYNTDA